MVIMMVHNNIWLVDVGGAMCPSWKYLKMMEFVNGKDYIPYMTWKRIQMFETTSQQVTWKSGTIIAHFWLAEGTCRSLAI